MIKERMIVMNKTTISSKRTRIVASLMMAALLLALSPISVLAYSPAPTCEYQEQSINMESDILYSVPEQNDSQDIYDPFFKCGTEYEILIYADGQLYIIDDIDQPVERIFCSHIWENCKIYLHAKNDDGSCTVSCYNGQRCILCASHKIADLVSTTNYVKCPH